MSMQEVLNKITDKNTAIVGCVAKSGDRIFHNLDDYDIEHGVIAESVSDMFDLASTLGDHCVDLSSLFSEYDGHCVIGQRVGDGMLVAVTEQLQRAGYKKLQVNLSLQTRLLAKAMEEAPAEDPAVASVLKATAKPAAPEPAAAAVDPNKGKRRRMYRGVVFWE